MTSLCPTPFYCYFIRNIEIYNPALGPSWLMIHSNQRNWVIEMACYLWDRALRGCAPLCLCHLVDKCGIAIWRGMTTWRRTKLPSSFLEHSIMNRGTRADSLNCNWLSQDKNKRMAYLNYRLVVSNKNVSLNHWDRGVICYTAIANWYMRAAYASDIKQVSLKLASWCFFLSDLNPRNPTYHLFLHFLGT